VKQLAEQANQTEIARQERERREREDKKTVALATCPFVEKLHLVIAGATEQFNKHCMFPQLRVTASKLYKHSKTGEEPTAKPDEVAYFTFSRLGHMYGIRGINGVVEFVTIPVGDTTYNIKLHEMSVPAVKEMHAELEPDTRKIRWVTKGSPLDGPAIVSMCQKFFIELIERTNSEIK
jgi:hypothetical protein